ncbi:MAG: M23 family metallopeptidase [Bacteroidota bacterium]|nr:M23 family metallopeptidase [Bacteroidota bacterium]
MIRILFIALSLVTIVEGPDKTNILKSPLDIPLILSANFGEPRTGHFHSGVDFKTEGITGKNVYAVAKGYIYRIVVSPTGFGKAVYIRHTNGLSTVYGHLSRFTPEIEDYVRENQYARKNFTVNLFPGTGHFPVNEGDIIGYSGNSGSSMGPHLHFEVRRSSEEKPLDPIQFYNIDDNIRPVIRSIAVYPAGPSSAVEGKREKLILNTTGNKGSYSTNQVSPVTVYGAIGFGINTHDYLDNSWNKCGVRIINLRVDDKLIYSHSIDEFPFSETRYINSHIDYEEKIKNSAYIQKTYLEPNNKLSTYNHIINNGIIEFNDGEIHEIEISVSDFNDNYSYVNFLIKSDTIKSYEHIENQGILMPFGEINEFKHHDIQVFFPQDCFYDTIDFNCRKAPSDRPGLYSDLHYIHNKYTPVHRQFDISIKTLGPISDELTDKLCLVYLDEDDKDIIYYAGGTWNNGFVEGSVSNFGLYSIGIDTITPSVEPLMFTDGSTLCKNDELRIIVKDEFSGIGEYEAFIDGSWALFEWDPKNSLLTYKPDPERIRQGEKHTLDLSVKDNLDNESFLNLDFYW